MEVANASTYCKVFNENIPLGLSKMKFPDMQFLLSIEEVEKLVEKTADDDLIELTLKPVEDNKITVKFEKWLPND